MTSIKNESKELSAMEFFILALVSKAHLNSLYALQQNAALQPGGIRPAIQRLELAGLLQRADFGKRRRRELIVTVRGEDILNRHWRDCLRGYPDVESVIRAATVALLMGDKHIAGQYLQGTGDGWKHSAEQQLAEAAHLGNFKQNPISTYAWMRVLCEAHRRRGESAALLSLRQSLIGERT